jgi:hypothetical protein
MTYISIDPDRTAEDVWDAITRLRAERTELVGTDTSSTLGSAVWRGVQQTYRAEALLWKQASALVDFREIEKPPGKPYGGVCALRQLMSAAGSAKAAELEARAEQLNATITLASLREDDERRAAAGR